MVLCRKRLKISSNFYFNLDFEPSLLDSTVKISEITEKLVKSPLCCCLSL